ncbi:hypothetical protein KPC83_05125 [Collinsella sp. zg1085]|uniref:ferritin-like domain-containing protein n=1 Tax=Collinsella sp. zg1085 TaxID=2844380 RepID=UPI001C0C2DCD|nr:ferritin-like domain-containing protein [Collinsella sp. zg1085]QWT17227.1 hypothetical protein KPC83_05125 [Collinsella sp. zg1085]
MSHNQELLDSLSYIVTALSQQADGHAVQSRIFASQGFSKLADKYAEHAQEERGYAEKIMDRILDLGGTLTNGAKEETPTYTKPLEWIAYDYEVSKSGIDYLKKIIDLAKDDLVTYDLLKDYYKDEEEDMYWGEQQLELVKVIGEQNWFALFI